VDSSFLGDLAAAALEKVFCKFSFLFTSPYFYLVSVSLSAKDETRDSEL